MERLLVVKTKKKMKILFIKDHTSGIPKGTVAEYNDNSGQKLIDDGYAREATKADEEEYQLAVKEAKLQEEEKRLQEEEARINKIKEDNAKKRQLEEKIREEVRAEIEAEENERIAKMKKEQEEKAKEEEEAKKKAEAEAAERNKREQELAEIELRQKIKQQELDKLRNGTFYSDVNTKKNVTEVDNGKPEENKVGKKKK